MLWRRRSDPRCRAGTPDLGPWHPGYPCDSTGGGLLYSFNSLHSCSGSDRVRMTRFIGPLGVLSVLVVSILFTTLNGAQRVTLNLGAIVLYDVPLTLVGFTGLFMGMVVMLVAGIRSDLKVRAVLRQRLEDEDREERALIDRNQQDLFWPPPQEDKGGEEEVL